MEKAAVHAAFSVMARGTLRRGCLHTAVELDRAGVGFVVDEYTSLDRGAGFAGVPDAFTSDFGLGVME